MIIIIIVSALFIDGFGFSALIKLAMIVFSLKIQEIHIDVVEFSEALESPFQRV